MSDVKKQLIDKQISPADAVEQAELEGISWLRDLPIGALKATPLDCGFPSLNREYLLKDGEGDVVIVAARTSIGKSAFCMQVALHVAASGRNVLVLSTEMGTKSLARRLLAGRTGLSSANIRAGQDYPTMVYQEYERLGLLPLGLVTDVPRDANRISNLVLAFHRRHPLGLVVVDYIQNLASRASVNRQQEVGRISLALRSLSKQVECPFLVAAQLNRNVTQRNYYDRESRAYKTANPDLSDIQDCGAIEQDADAVVLLSRPNPDEVLVDIAKNRDGATGQFTFKWVGATTRFIDPDEISGI